MSELVVGSIAGLSANGFVVDVASGSTLDLTNATSLPSSALPTGSVLQVVSASKTDTFSSSLAAGAGTAITGLSATITPTSSNSKILAFVTVGQMANSRPRAIVALRLMRNSVSLAPANVGTRLGLNYASLTVQTDIAGKDAGSFHYFDSPNTTSAVTYSVEAFNMDDSTWTLYVNRNGSDSDATFQARTSSSITLMEVAG